jgi:N-acetylmuramoyl-L-alanine amidase
VIYFWSEAMKRAFVLDLVIGFLIIILIVTLNYNYIDVFLHKIVIDHSKVIMIDAGHGGMDGGGVGSSGVMEKNINLSISKKLKGYLETQGYTCVMVRETDEGLYSPIGSIRDRYNEGLRNRKEIIKEFNCDILLSIHLNKFPEEKYYGAQVFYLKGDPKSQELAVLVQNSLKEVINRGNTRVAKPSDSYYLLKGNAIPSIIIECGFLSNNEEEALLTEDSYQNKLAWSIYIGLVKYLKSL